MKTVAECKELIIANMPFPRPFMFSSDMAYQCGLDYNIDMNRRPGSNFISALRELGFKAWSEDGVTVWYPLNVSKTDALRILGGGHREWRAIRKEGINPISERQTSFIASG